MFFCCCAAADDKPVEIHPITVFEQETPAIEQEATEPELVEAPKEPEVPAPKPEAPAPEPVKEPEKPPEAASVVRCTLTRKSGEAWGLVVRPWLNYTRIESFKDAGVAAAQNKDLPEDQKLFEGAVITDANGCQDGKSILAVLQDAECMTLNLQAKRSKTKELTIPRIGTMKWGLKMDVTTVGLDIAGVAPDSSVDSYNKKQSDDATRLVPGDFIVDVNGVAAASWNEGDGKKATETMAAEIQKAGLTAMKLMVESLPK